MKKNCVFILTVVLLVTMLIVACAADTYLFRNIPWYSTKTTASDALDSLKTSRNSSNTTMPDWFQKWSNITGDYKVEEAGAYVGYSGVTVAGYNASLYTYYMYPIVDGRVSRNDDNAEFYLAIYDFEKLTDMQAVYDDLVQKLTGLYGESTALNNPDSWTDFTGRLWTADDGSQIWLRKFNDNNKVKLSYIAPNSTERLQALEAQITQEKIEAEELERKNNETNTDGL